jgi:hypothetical protein
VLTEKKERIPRAEPGHSVLTIASKPSLFSGLLSIEMFTSPTWLRLKLLLPYETHHLGLFSFLVVHIIINSLVCQFHSV